ncbi:MAG: hypothetical protein U9O64_02600 [Campylobacterota bacterium]|nr:hypothetical protein [Campylobacterota bacterium]
MKRNDFITSLKRIKSQIIFSQKRPKNALFSTKVSHQKRVCTCTDSNGEPKYLYHTHREMEYILSSTQISLTSYPCPYEKGWHLTKG